MIYLDDQGGSGNREKGISPASLVHTLKPMLDDRNLPLTVKTLPAGDVKFIGCGPEGRPVRVGVEIKTVNEFLSSIYTKRLSRLQVPLMVKHYEDKWLIVEGQIRRSDNGRVELLHPFLGWVEPLGASHDWGTVQSFLLSLRIKGGINVWFVADRDGTADWIASLYYWWRKDWDKHTTFNGVYLGANAQPEDSGGDLVPVGKVRTAASVLFGAKRARTKVLTVAPTFEAMVQTPLETWKKILGPVLGEQAYKILRSRE